MYDDEPSRVFAVPFLCVSPLPQVSDFVYVPSLPPPPPSCLRVHQNSFGTARRFTYRRGVGDSGARCADDGVASISYGTTTDAFTCSSASVFCDEYARLLHVMHRRFIKLFFLFITRASATRPVEYSRFFFWLIQSNKPNALLPSSSFTATTSPPPPPPPPPPCRSGSCRPAGKRVLSFQNVRRAKVDFSLSFRPRGSGGAHAAHASRRRRTRAVRSALHIRIGLAFF